MNLIKSSNKTRANRTYLLLATILFIIEVLIALFVNDKFIRPFVGDVLVVIFIYCFLKIFWKAKTVMVATSVLLFAFCIEVLQYFHFVEVLGLSEYKILAVALGNSFSWHDFIAYTAGFLIILLFEPGYIQFKRKRGK